MQHRDEWFVDKRTYEAHILIAVLHSPQFRFMFLIIEAFVWKIMFNYIGLLINEKAFCEHCTTVTRLIASCAIASGSLRRTCAEKKKIQMKSFHRVSRCNSTKGCENENDAAREMFASKSQRAWWRQTIRLHILIPTRSSWFTEAIIYSALIFSDQI